MRKKNTYIIAEVGINHSGRIENCYGLIDAAKDAGCDAVKFQYFNPKYLYPKSAGEISWRDRKKKYSYDIYSAAEKNKLPDKWIDPLIEYSRKRKIDFLSSVFDTKGAAFLIKRGMKKIKLSSYVVTNIPLVEYCARSKLPIIMSTGGATLGEIEEAVSVITRQHKELCLLHCSLNYPTALEDCNLGVIETLRRVFPDCSVGYSDHTAEISRAPQQAVYLGARVIEKHITLDKKMPGPDHFFALEPHQLKQMVADIRKAEVNYKRGEYNIDGAVYGSAAKTIRPAEKYIRDFAYMQLFAKKAFRPGETMCVTDIAVLRRGTKKYGLEPKYLKFFSRYRIKAKRAIGLEDPITWDCIL